MANTKIYNTFFCVLNVQHSKTYKSTTHFFCASSHRFKYISILCLAFKQVGQGVQFSQLHNSMTNVKLFKTLLQILKSTNVNFTFFIFANV